MAGFKGTKGKWEAKNLFNNWIITDNKDNVLNIRDNEANAKLMAAAPELLEALEEIIEMNRQTALDQYGDAEKAESWSCVTIARKAIKKATE